MTGFIYSIAFNITGQSSVMKAVEATDKLDKSVNKVKSDVGGMGNAAERAGNQARRSFDGAASSLKSWIVGLGIGVATLSSLNAAAQLEGVNTFIEFASAGEGAKNIEFLNQTVHALGLNLESTSGAYRTWLGGIQGTNISMQQQRDIFYGVAEAASVMRLSGDQTQGVFLALSQMASKGKVSAEELRGQLGERLPGAFAIAARAMGVSTMALDKMMANGELMAEDFLPKFAAELHKTFGGAVGDATNSATANFNRFQNSLFYLKTTFGNELLPIVTSFLQGYLIPAISWISQHIDLIVGLGSVIGGIVVVTKLWAAGQAILNLVMAANPIGIVITAIGALIGAVVYAWNKFEGFRGFMVGMWEVIKEMGSILMDYLVAPLMNTGKLLLGIFTFDAGMIESGFSDMVNTIAKMSDGLGERLGSAFHKGYQNGIQKTVDAPAFAAPDAVSSAFANGPGGGGSVGGSGAGAGGLNISKGVQGITGGGSKNITINLQSLVQGFTINTQTASEGVDELGVMVERKLLQVLNSANQTQ